MDPVRVVLPAAAWIHIYILFDFAELTIQCKPSGMSNLLPAQADAFSCGVILYALFAKDKLTLCLQRTYFEIP